MITKETLNTIREELMNFVNNNPKFKGLKTTGINLAFDANTCDVKFTLADPNQQNAEQEQRLNQWFRMDSKEGFNRNKKVIGSAVETKDGSLFKISGCKMNTRSDKWVVITNSKGKEYVCAPSYITAFLEQPN